MIHDLLFEVFQINVIPVVLTENQVTAYDHTVIVPDHLRKRIVDRLLDQDTVPRFRKCFHCHREGKYHTGRLDQPLLPDFPVVMALHPSGHRIKILLLGITVTKDPMLRPLDQGIHHIVTYRKNL